jgi:excisionase family DNA binding protein
MEKGLSEKLLHVKEVAECLGLRVSTIRSWVLHRRIEAVRVGRRAIRIPSSAIEKIVRDGRIPARESRP